MKVTLTIDRGNGAVQQFDAQDNTLFCLGLVGQVMKSAIAANSDEVAYVAKLVQAFTPIFGQIKTLLDFGEFGDPGGIDITEVPDGAGCGEGVVT